MIYPLSRFNQWTVRYLITGNEISKWRYGFQKLPLSLTSQWFHRDIPRFPHLPWVFNHFVLNYFIIISPCISFKWSHSTNSAILASLSNQHLRVIILGTILGIYERAISCKFIIFKLFTTFLLQIALRLIISGMKNSRLTNFFHQIKLFGKWTF